VIVMEPIRDNEPTPEFIRTVQKIARDEDAVLIVDEVSSGFRLRTGGAHSLYGLNPDIAVFAKAMSNGYPMAAIIGKEETMQSAQDTFISSTYWTEGIGPVAALATIEKYERCNVPEHLVGAGTQVQDGWRKAVAMQSGFDIEIGGIPPLSHFSVPGEQSLLIQTLYTQLMLERGFLAGKSFYASYAHQKEQIASYLEATTEVFEQIAKGLDTGTLRGMLKGPVAKPGFHRLT
jgi:glutamate-1-semialdehyde 2,1-aminomutase